MEHQTLQWSQVRRERSSCRTKCFAIIFVTSFSAPSRAGRACGFFFPGRRSLKVMVNRKYFSTATKFFFMLKVGKRSSGSLKAKTFETKKSQVPSSDIAIFKMNRHPVISQAFLYLSYNCKKEAKCFKTRKPSCLLTYFLDSIKSHQLRLRACLHLSLILRFVFIGKVELT